MYLGNQRMLLASAIILGASALGGGSLWAQGAAISPQLLAQAEPQKPGEERRKEQQPGQPRGTQTQPPAQGPQRGSTQQPERQERRAPGGPGTPPAQPRTTQPAQPPQQREQGQQERRQPPAAQQPGPTQPRTTQQPPAQPPGPPPAQRRETQQPSPTAPRTTQQPPAQQQPGAAPTQRRETQQPSPTAPRTTTQQPSQPPGPPGRPGQAPGAPARPQTTQQPPAQPPGTPPRQETQRPPAPGTPAPAQAIRPVQPQPGVATADPRQQQQQFEALRQQRRERVEDGGRRTVIEEPDHRMIVRENDRVFVRHDEVERFRFAAQDVRVERRGGETITVVRRPGDVEIVTYVDDDGRLLRRVRRTRDGREFVLIDNRFRGPGRAEIFVALPPPRIVIPREDYIVEMEYAPRERIFAALEAPPIERIERPYTLDEIRFSSGLRDRMRRVDLDTINFEFGSWQIAPDQIPLLANIAEAINAVVTRNPNEVFLIEGHTDAVGNDVDNLSLSDRRAESVAVILSQNFQVPPENLTTQGYGAQQLKVQTPGPSRENRRVTIRRITPLLTGSAQ
jgi:outer membrane protein OmpA-like peptidoglycan-associated protein